MTRWYDTDVVGIDTGITLLMAENLRTGFVWNTFSKNPEVPRALDRAGFRRSVSLPPGFEAETYGRAAGRVRRDPGMKLAGFSCKLHRFVIEGKIVL